MEYKWEAAFHLRVTSVANLVVTRDFTPVNLELGISVAEGGEDVIDVDGAVS